MNTEIVMALVSLAERNYQERIRLQYLRDNSNPFNVPEARFRKLYRLPKSGAFQLIQDLDCPRLNKGDLPKHLKVQCYATFYSSSTIVETGYLSIFVLATGFKCTPLFVQGSYQAPVGQDNLIALSQPSVSRCIKITTDLIVEKLMPIHIRFPLSETEKLAAMADFQFLFNMPNTIGAVDGTHIAIIKPPLNHHTAPGNLFYNRKGVYSINCQIVCNAKEKIIGLNPNFPGSTHDAAIWGTSNVYHYLKSTFLRGERNQWLLGDTGYPLQPWFMTPLLHPTTDAEVAYNSCHARARNVVEMCNGHIKNKFRCLHRHRCLHYKQKRAAKIILACCKLFNMFLGALNGK